MSDQEGYDPEEQEEAQEQEQEFEQQQQEEQQEVMQEEELVDEDFEDADDAGQGGDDDNDGGGEEGEEQQQEEQQEEGDPGEPPRQMLRFCPESNHILYPRENRGLARLEYYCKTCGYWETAPRGPAYCVYVSETKHDAKEQTVVLQDVSADPTLPRTREVVCPNCANDEAVFFSASSEQGMTLYFNCMKCHHRWRDYV